MSFNYKFNNHVRDNSKRQWNNYRSATHLCIKKEIKHIKILLTQLQQPTMIWPKLSKDMDTAEVVLFQEEVQQYIKDK